MSSVMVKCPQGHSNPSDWQLCGECGSPIEGSPNLFNGRWSRKTWAMVAAGVLAIAAISVSAVGLVTRDDDTGASARTSTDSAAILEWWAGAREPFAALQESLDDSQRALVDADRSAMQKACQRMHDTSAVELQVYLPAPTQELTSELIAAATDAHDASHMCMSVLEGSMNSYDGEFPVDVRQAEKHLAAAQELISQAITSTS